MPLLRATAKKISDLKGKFIETDDWWADDFADATFSLVEDLRGMFGSEPTGPSGTVLREWLAKWKDLGGADSVQFEVKLLHSGEVFTYRYDGTVMVKF